MLMDLEKYSAQTTTSDRTGLWLGSTRDICTRHINGTAKQVCLEQNNKIKLLNNTVPMIEGLRKLRS